MNFCKLAGYITLTAAFALGGLAPQLLAAGDTPSLPDGVTTEDWSMMRESIVAQRHAFRSTAAGFEASNPRFAWDAEFDGDSSLIQPRTGDWSFGLALQSYGFPGDLQELSRPVIGACAAGQQMTYGWTEELSEWWVNDQRGFEHGFTVHERPLCRAVDTSGPLTFELEVRGTLTPKVNAARTGLSLSDQEGGVVLRYDGLVAFDANGVALEAWLEVDGDALRISVEESCAVYPILVDPVVQEAYLKASNTEALDSFGFSIAASGDTIVVGAPDEDSNSVGVDGDQSDNGAQGSGAAYVFVRSGSSWSQQAYLKASNTGDFDRFGRSVAISGDTVVVGAAGEDSGAVGVDGDQSDNSTLDGGAAYVFVRSGMSWSQQAYLKASNTQALDVFGGSVAVSGDTIVVGAFGERSSSIGVDGDQSDNSAFRSGAAYVFVRSGMSWSQQAYLKASNTGQGDEFGSSVAASGDTIVVGAFREDSNSVGIDGDQSGNSASLSGAAYVFVRSGTSWSQQAYLKASNTGEFDGFGESVAVSGDTIVVGARFEDSRSVGVDGDQSDNSLLSSGAAYVFVRSGMSWSQQAYLKASNTQAGDFFGLSVAASGDTIVVGASFEDSSSVGVDGDQFDNSALSSGAAYVFVRSGTSWSQQVYLKASNAGANDEFGRSVAASDGSVIVGALGEASDATGVNGDGSNNTAAGAGAAYIFTGIGESIGRSYCVAAINSTGAAGRLEGSGSASIAENCLRLAVKRLPPTVFGLFITSTSQDFVANPGGSEGNLCLGGSIGRYVEPGQLQQADAGGAFSLQLDLTNTPQPSGAVSISAGETWNFQAWYRDSGSMGSTSNLTNGLEVVFTM